VPVTDDEVARLAEQLLYQEAEFLDERDLHGWLALLAEDIDYRAPVRVTRERLSGTSPFSGRSFHFIEDHGSLAARVRRFDTEYAWAEDPPSRTRRFVTNVRARIVGPDEIGVRSNLLLFRSRAGDENAQISCERQDLWRRSRERWLLARRLVLLDHTAIPMENMAAFL